MPELRFLPFAAASAKVRKVKLIGGGSYKMQFDTTPALPSTAGPKQPCLHTQTHKQEEHAAPSDKGWHGAPRRSAHIAGTKGEKETQRRGGGGLGGHKRRDKNKKKKGEGGNKEKTRKQKQQMATRGAETSDECDQSVPCSDPCRANGRGRDGRDVALDFYWIHLSVRPSV